MFKKIILPGILILYVTTIFAQNNSLKISLKTLNKADSELKISFVLSKKLDNGFAVELPGAMKSAIKAVSANGKLLWLKEIDSPPLKQNTLHWRKTSTGYIIRLSAENLAAGTPIEIAVQAPLNTIRRENQRIALKEIVVRDNGAIEPFSEIAANSIPKPQNE